MKNHENHKIMKIMKFLLLILIKGHFFLNHLVALLFQLTVANKVFAGILRYA